jgi:hypothetical protein
MDDECVAGEVNSSPIPYIRTKHLTQHTKLISVMEIAEELLRGFNLLKDANKINNQLFNEIVTLSFDILSNKEKTEGILSGKF